MRPVLAVSLAAALAASGYAAYSVVPTTSRRPSDPVPLVKAEPGPYRVIPMNGDAPPAARPAPKVAEAPKAAEVPKSPAAVETVARDPAPSVVAPVPAPAAAPNDAPPRDVLQDVARTLGRMRDAPVQPAGDPPVVTLSKPQEDALRLFAARRKVKPVTKLTFPLREGAEVPSQVYLHPVPPEVAAMAQPGQNLGFAILGGRFVVVASETRKVVAVGGV